MAQRLGVNVLEYLRPGKKLLWCPGCGIGIVLGAIIRAIAHLRLDKNEVVMVSGIGCSGRMTGYVDFNTLHTTHGRALAFATGIKLAKPNLKVIVVMGDGDALAIGGNHLIHAARRNVDLTAIIINNNVYGMTGGQYSPTLPLNDISTTTPYGNLEPPFDTVKLVEAAGAPFVARSTVYHAFELERLIRRGIEKKGFSVIEALADCPVQYGRYNKMPSAIDMLKWYRDNTAIAGTAGGNGKLLRGVLVDRDMPEYLEQYHELLDKLRGSREDD